MAKVWVDMGGGVQELQDDASSYKAGYAPQQALNNSGIIGGAQDTYYQQARELLNNSGNLNLTGSPAAASYTNGGAQNFSSGFGAVGAPLQAPAPAPAPGIISSASTPAPAPMTQAPPAPAPSTAAPPSFGMVGGGTGAPAPVPAAPPAPAAPAPAAPAPATSANIAPIAAAMKNIDWSPSNTGPAVQQAVALALQNGWTLEQLQQAMPWTTLDGLRSYITQYGGTAGAQFLTGTPAPGPAPAPGSSSTGIISGANRAAQLGTPTDWTVTADQTVEGRINNLTNPNSPLQQAARARALDAAAGKGLSNSSMAVTAGELAGYDAALPIAQADAATFAKAAGYGADQKNQFAVRNQDATNQFSLQANEIEAQKQIAAINRETQESLTKLDASLRAQATEVAANNDKLLQTNSQAAQAFNQAVAAVNNINLSDKMDAATKTKAVANVWQSVQTQFKVLGATVGLNLNQQLNFAQYPGFDAQGNWVGFEDGDGAITRGSAPAAPAPAPSNPANGGGGSGWNNGQY